MGEILPLWMLLEERIGGQTWVPSSRRRFLQRSLARRHAGRPPQEWACQPRGNRRQRDSLPSVLVSGLGRRNWILPGNPSNEDRASQSGNLVLKLCESPWLAGTKRRGRGCRLVYGS